MDDTKKEIGNNEQETRNKNSAVEKLENRKKLEGEQDKARRGGSGRLRRWGYETKRELCALD